MSKRRRHAPTIRPGSTPCRHTLEQLCDVLEVQLGHVEATVQCRQILEHVEHCPTCCVDVDTLTKTVRIFQAIPRREVPHEISWRLLRTLHLEPPPGGERKRKKA